ncbi:MAG: 2-hydroxyacyl-CoA dehydratase [Deltaproteobacteria bacterium]|nr:2-hydroxyacyl-CoA dehydratase [Deltaproteobacteria bacterium]
MTSPLESKAFAVMSEATGGLKNPEIQAWKEQGGKVVGYFCSMLPQEMFMAAGLLPFRMRATGSTGTDGGDSYFTNNNCTFVRHCFSLALEGGYDFLDGLVVINSCDQIRRIYDNWIRKVDTPFVEIIALPRSSGPDQVTWYCEEFERLKARIEEHFEVEITPEALREAIQVCNETRRLQRELYELRKKASPPITGAEALSVMVASTAMPNARYNVLLRELLDDIQGRELEDSYRARLMVTGGILDDPGWIEAVEEVGGLVVTDGTCFGGRLMSCDIDEEADPMQALAQYYLADRPSCPRMIDTQVKRKNFTVEMAREFDCDGIIGEKMMFCDMWQVEQFMMTMDLKEEEIPFLKLEREYVTSGTGQLKTRVQAFIEAMGK